MSLRRSTRLASSTTTATLHVEATHTAALIETTSLSRTGNKRKRAASRSEASEARSNSQRQGQEDSTDLGSDSDAEQGPKKEKKKKRSSTRKRVAVPVYTAEDFPARTSIAWKVGPHVSAAGGVENTVINAASIGATAFALFVKSQRKWSSNDLTPESVAAFKSRMTEFGYSPEDVLPHGSYLVNLGNPDKAKRDKSYDCFLDDIKRCELLGLKLYNFHPGSTVGQVTPEESCSLIADGINRAHNDTSSVVIVLENMAGAGNIIGSSFEQLRLIIDGVVDKSRVGVCLDTCHMFAAGYDIRTKEGWNTTMDEFDRVIGQTYLRGMHLNDSKSTLGSKKDRHENIGLGELSITTFQHILTDPRTQHIPLILETPAFDGPGSALASGMDVWSKEVEILKQISGDHVQDEKERAGLEEMWADEIREVVLEMKAGKEAKEEAKKEKKRKLSKARVPVSSHNVDSDEG